MARYLLATHKQFLLAAIVLFAAVLAVYGQTLSFGFLLQDEWAILDNPVFQQPRSITRVLPSLLGPRYARTEVPVATEPLVLASQLIDRALFGMRPWAFRLHALLLHALVALALFHFVRSRASRFLERHGPQAPLSHAHRGRATGIALFSACAFAVHPLAVEPVAAIAYRGTLQVALLSFLCLALIDLARRGNGSRARWLRVLALLLVVAAGFANAGAIVAPLLLVACDVLASDTERARLTVCARDWALWTAAAAVAPLWRLWALDGSPAWPAHLLDQGNVLRFGERSLQGLWGFWATLGKLFVPIGLSAEYQERFFNGNFERTVAASMVAGLLLLPLLAWRLRQRAPLGALGLLLGAIAHLPALLPALGPVPSSPAQADRYAYLPLAFWIPAVVALVMALAQVLARRLQLSARLRVIAAHSASLGIPLGAVLSVLPVAALAVSAHTRARVWSDDTRLWQDATEVAPLATRAFSKLAFAALAANDLRSAATHAGYAIAIGGGADAHWALGRTEMRRGALDFSCQVLATARELSAEVAGARVDLLVDLAHCLTQTARSIDALSVAREASHRAPWFERARLQEAQTLEALGRFDEAAQVLRGLHSN